MRSSLVAVAIASVVVALAGCSSGPDEAAIERSAIMQYFDVDASKQINQMWINVRCYNIKDVTPQVWAIVVILILAAAGLIVHYKRSHYHS